MLHDPNTRRIMTLSAEIDSAAAMMALVRYATDPELIRRYKEVAMRSYQSALDLIVVTSLTPKEEHEIWDRLAPIRQWLEAERLLGTEANQAVNVDSVEARELAALLAPKRTT
jgi:hypothetical protein